MSLIENIVSQISTNGLGSATKIQSFDMNDMTFENLLQKGLDSIANAQQNNTVGYMGVPAGFNIEPINKPAEIEPIKAIDTSDVQIKDVNTDDFFTNILKTQPSDNNGIFDFAKKYATNAYNVFAGRYITDLRDMIENTTPLS